jgi:hypothetical protein
MWYLWIGYARVEGAHTMSDPTHGYYKKGNEWVPGIARQRIQERLAPRGSLPLGFGDAWTKRDLTRGESCSGCDTPIQNADRDAVEYVSRSEPVVRFCGRCFGCWQKEVERLR